MIGDMGVGSWGGPVHDPRTSKEKITVEQLYALFGKAGQERWLASADSQEYLNVICYILERNNRRTA